MIGKRHLDNTNHHFATADDMREMSDQFVTSKKRNAEVNEVEKNDSNSDSDSDEEEEVVTCYHVRTGTIIIGLWHILLQVMALSLIFMTRGGETHFILIAQNVTEVLFGYDAVCLCPLSSDNCLNWIPIYTLLLFGNILSNPFLYTVEIEINGALFMVSCTLLVTLLFVFAAIRYMPSHLMPFFFVQIFDFCISSMMIATGNFPEFLSKRCCSACLTFVISIASLLVKGYLINIVWRCYIFFMIPGGVSGQVKMLSGKV